MEEHDIPKIGQLDEISVTIFGWGILFKSRKSSYLIFLANAGITIVSKNTFFIIKHDRLTSEPRTKLRHSLLMSKAVQSEIAAEAHQNIAVKAVQRNCDQNSPQIKTAATTRTPNCSVE